MSPSPPPHLSLDNFTKPSEVPENCPFVLTSPRSLQACQLAGIKPVDLLPSTLEEYEAALPDLDREKVLSIFREVETAKEGKLFMCKELRNEIIVAEEKGEDTQEVQRFLENKDARGRKLSCLSPIVEVVGSGASPGFESPQRKYNRESEEPIAEHPLEDIDTVMEEDKLSKSNLEENTEVDYSGETHKSDFSSNDRNRRLSASLPAIHIEDEDEDDQPESDRHVRWDTDMRHEGDFVSEESELFLSEMDMSLTPSPIGDISRMMDMWTISCPDLDQDSHIQNKNFLSPCPSTKTKKTSHKKRKASRRERLNSGSLQSLIDVSTNDLQTNQITKTPWHHSKSNHVPVTPGSSKLVRTALSRSSIDIDRLQISQQDLRILEIMALRSHEEYQRQTRQHELQVQWEEEKSAREQKKSELEKNFRRQITAKRRQEDVECQRRLQIAREGFLKCQEHLRQLLKEKDDRKKELLDTIARKKEELIAIHTEREETKRMTVDRAVNELLSKDTQYRLVLKNQVEEKLKQAERKRVQQEKTRASSLNKTSRSNMVEHQLRVQKLEELYEDHIEKIKLSIQKKLKQSSQRLGKQKPVKTYNPSLVLSLKSELEAGLDLWRKQVLSVQSQSIRRAEEKYRKEIEARRARVSKGIKGREKRYNDKKKEQEEIKRSRLTHTMQKMENRNKKVDQLLSEREKSIIQARRMAENSAKLRDILKRKYI